MLRQEAAGVYVGDLVVWAHGVHYHAKQRALRVLDDKVETRDRRLAMNLNLRHLPLLQRL